MNTQDWAPLGWTGCSPRDSQESSPTPEFKSINSSVLSFLYSPTLTSIHDYWKTIALTRRTFVDKVMSLFFIYFFKIFFKLFIFLLYNTVLVLSYINMNLPWVYMSSQSWTPLPPPSPYHLSGSSQCTSPKHPVSCIEHRLVIHFLHDSIHVSMPFSQIIPPSPSPTESKSLFYTSVSLLLSRIQGYHYHLSKFHIYVLVFCIGVFLSGLLHSV